MLLHNAGVAQGCPDCWSNITYMPGVQYNFPRVLRGAAYRGGGSRMSRLLVKHLLHAWCSIQFSPGTACCCILRGRLKDVPTALPAPWSRGHRQTCERCLPQLFICTLGRPYLLLLIYYLSETHRKPLYQQNNGL